MPSIEVKRLHLEDFVLKEKCPKCGVESVVDLGHPYCLNYPDFNDSEKPCRIVFYCNCDELVEVGGVFEVAYELKIELNKVSEN